MRSTVSLAVGATWILPLESNTYSFPLSGRLTVLAISSLSGARIGRRQKSILLRTPSSIDRSEQNLMTRFSGDSSSRQDALLECAGGGHELRRLAFRYGTSIQHTAGFVCTGAVGRRTIPVLLHEPKHRELRRAGFDQCGVAVGGLDGSRPGHEPGRRTLQLHRFERHWPSATLLPAAGTVNCSEWFCWRR